MPGCRQIVRKVKCLGFIGLGMFALGSTIAGCDSTPGPEVLAVEPGSYTKAFDASMDAARGHGMAPALRDRRMGVIETDAHIAGSLLEPWRYDEQSLDHTLQATQSLVRRRARFEFATTDFRPQVPADRTELTGPDLLSESGMTDLTNHVGPLELRVWVYVERNTTRGTRRDPWSGRLTSRFVADRPPSFWTPVTRDREFERRLLAEVEAALAAESPATDGKDT